MSPLLIKVRPVPFYLFSFHLARGEGPRWGGGRERGGGHRRAVVGCSGGWAQEPGKGWVTGVWGASVGSKGAWGLDASEDLHSQESQ